MALFQCTTFVHLVLALCLDALRHERANFLTCFPAELTHFYEHVVVFKSDP